MVADLIILSQAGVGEATMELIEKFNPLLRKYARELYYGDAYNDLIVDYIEFLKNIRIDSINDCEGSLVSYIAKSIRNSYIKRSMDHNKLCRIIPFSALNEDELYCIEAESAVFDESFELELSEISHVLTKSEFLVIKLLYLSNRSVAEIASTLGVSRQAINQMKMRALKKIKNWLEQAYEES